MEHKRIGSPFSPDFCRRAVTREDGDVVAERKNLSSDAFYQEIEIATGQIAPADAAREKDIAADEQLFIAREKTETARAMAGDFQNLKIGTEEILAGRFFNEEVRLHRFDLELETEVSKKIAISNHRRGQRMTTDGTAELALDSGGILNVIDVPVGQKQEPGNYIKRIYPFAGAFRRVEKDRSLWRWNQVAIRFEDAAAKGLVFDRWHVDK